MKTEGEVCVFVYYFDWFYLHDLALLRLFNKTLIFQHGRAVADK